jgi:hypothetical protein
MENTEPESKPLAAWTSVPIILLCLAGGGWLIHWYINTGDLNQESKLLDTTTPTEVASFTGPVEAPIEQQPDGKTWVVRNREAVLRVDQAKGAAARVISGSYRSTDIFPADVWKSILDGRAVVRSATWQKTLGTTPEQLAQLKSATGPVLMVMAAGDSQHMLELWNAYAGANALGKDAAQEKLLGGLSDVARKSVDATRQDVAERAGKIKSALSDGQWKQFNGG